MTDRKASRGRGPRGLAAACLIACPLAWLIALAAGAQTRPASYDEFDVSIRSGDARALKAAIARQASNFLYLPRGVYVIDNPVVIDRTQPLFIHGADRMGTVLLPRDPAQPLFVVQNAPLLNFAGVHFNGGGKTLNARAIRTLNTRPLKLELQDCFVDAAMLEFAGPGSYHVQSCALTPGGRAGTGILVDHPDADVLVFGGDETNGGEPLRAEIEYAHMWQKRGRLRVYSTTLEGALGASDIRIESRSALGPHVLANVRSEGANGALNHKGVSRLLYVPPTSEAVDVVVKNSVGGWLTGPDSPVSSVSANCKLVGYNGAGTLWLLGNRAEVCGRHLVEGNAPQATIVSIGNVITSPEPFTVSARRIFTAVDAYNNAQWSGLQANPQVRWIPANPTLPKLAAGEVAPVPPPDELPPALERPVMRQALPGMIDVLSSPYGAHGDGVTDDTAAIQRALDAQCDGATPKAVYFPQGTYRISDTLYLNHRTGGKCHNRMPYGGWIAGAGSKVTTIEMAPGVKKGVFATDGLAMATVQGIRFKTWTWRPGDPKEPVFDIEMAIGFPASQQNNLYDVVFEGGYIGFATGVAAPTGGQCSSNAIFQGVMKNAQMGFVSGHYNAIANVVYDSQFIDNATAMAAWTDDENQMPPGGTFAAYRSTSRGGTQQDFLFRGSAIGSSWYFYQWDSDAPSAFGHVGANGTAFPIMLEHSRFAPRAGSASAFVFDIASAQGVFFLDSTVVGGIRVGQSGMAQSYAVKMASEISGWKASVAAPNGQLEAFSR